MNLQQYKDEVTIGPYSFFSFSFTLQFTPPQGTLVDTLYRNLKSTQDGVVIVQVIETKKKKKALFFPPQISPSHLLILSHFPIQISLKTTLY